MLSNDITDLSVAADSGLWITHYHFGVDYYDRKTKLFTPYSSKNVKGLEVITGYQKKTVTAICTLAIISED